MSAPAQWSAAALASVVIHVAAGFGLALVLVPAPPPDQERRPEARLDLATYRVERTEARPAETRGERAGEQAPDAATLPGEAVPVGRAAALKPETAALDGVPATGEAIAPVSEVGETVTTIRQAGDAAEPVTQPGQPAVAASATAEVAAPISADLQEPVLVDTPRAPAAILAPAVLRLADANPEVSVVAEAGVSPVSASLAMPEVTLVREDQSRPDPAPQPELQAVLANPADPPKANVTSTRPRADPAETVPAPETAALAIPPPAGVTTAALVWSGGAGDSVDAVSLAAIQSFMQPGDPDAGDPVRDGIEGLLASVPCARLQTVFDPATGALELRGHVPEQGLRGPVLSAVQAQVGTAIPVSDNIRILPRPQCGALSGIAAVGLPQSEAQERNPRVMGEGAHARVYEFAGGERLQFELQGPDYPAFFYIDYFDAEGMVLHLQPNDYVPLRGIAVKEVVQIGSANADGPSLEITVAPPFGQEIMVAFAASRPLYEGLRPIREPAGPYLEMLRGAVAEARAGDPDFKGEWVYFFVETRAG